MHLEALDWAFAAATAVLCAAGLVRGLSGLVAFLTASAATAAFEVWCWPAFSGLIGQAWARFAVFAFAGFVVFGLVRVAVKKLVGGLLDQPADSLAGFAAGLACSALVVFAASRFGVVTERSVVAREVAAHVR